MSAEQRPQGESLDDRTVQCDAVRECQSQKRIVFPPSKCYKPKQTQCTHKQCYIAGVCIAIINLVFIILLFVTLNEGIFDFNLSELPPLVKLFFYIAPIALMAVAIILIIVGRVLQKRARSESEDIWQTATQSRTDDHQPQLLKEPPDFEIKTSDDALA